MEPRIAVGLESTLDTLITFPKLENFENFASDYEGELAPHIETGYSRVAEGSGGEIPIDGKREEAKELLDLAREEGAEIEYRLGGNGAQESVTLERLGSETIFVGGISPKSLSKLSQSNRISLEKIDTSFAQTLEKYSPTSYILQASGTNRYILSEGKGRRIDQLRSYLEELPAKLKEIEEEHGELDALSLVGWQVIFGNGLTKSDFELTNHVLRDIRENTDALLFTDAGGIESLSDEEKERLCKIYSQFDVISANEDEISQILEASSLESDGRFEAMSAILEGEGSVSSVWLHTPDYQATLSSDFSREILEKAQDLAALAGLYKVESGSYPKLEDLNDCRESRDFAEEALERVEGIREAYGEKISGREFVVTPCYESERFVSTVGAGDVSSAAYLYSLAKERVS